MGCTEAAKKKSAVIFAVNKQVHVLNPIRDQTKGETDKVAGGFLNPLFLALLLFALFCQLLGTDCATWNIPLLAERPGLKNSASGRSCAAAWRLHLSTSPWPSLFSASHMSLNVVNDILGFCLSTCHPSLVIHLDDCSEEPSLPGNFWQRSCSCWTWLKCAGSYNYFPTSAKYGCHRDIKNQANSLNYSNTQGLYCVCVFL